MRTAALLSSRRSAACMHCFGQAGSINSVILQTACMLPVVQMVCCIHYLSSSELAVRVSAPYEQFDSHAVWCDRCSLGPTLLSMTCK